jgi:hypothetical protein
MKKSNKNISRKNKKTTKKRGGSILSRISKFMSSLRKPKKATTLWTEKELESFKSMMKPATDEPYTMPYTMKKGNRYFIERGDGCTFETGVFDEMIYEGIHESPSFRKMRLLYKNKAADCEDFPASWTLPKYSQDGDTEIGRTGEIRPFHENLFYEWTRSTESILVEKAERSKTLKKLPEEVVSHEIRSYI